MSDTWKVVKVRQGGATFLRVVDSNGTVWRIMPGKRRGGLEIWLDYTETSRIAKPENTGASFDRQQMIIRTGGNRITLGACDVFALEQDRG